MDPSRKAEVLHAAAVVLGNGGDPLRCRLVPFVSGRRPAAEALHPGLGSSEEVAVLLPGAGEDQVWLLYSLSGSSAETGSVRARVSFTGPDGNLAPVPVPGWRSRH